MASEKTNNPNTFNPQLEGVSSSGTPSVSATQIPQDNSMLIEGIFSGISNGIDWLSDRKDKEALKATDDMLTKTVEDFSASRDTSSLPSDAVNGVNRMGNYKDALQQGAMSSREYYTRVMNEAKTLKAAYPSRVSAINDQISKTLGTDPRKAILEAYQASDNAVAKQQAEYQKWVTDKGRETGILFYNSDGSVDYGRTEASIIDLNYQTTMLAKQIQQANLYNAKLDQQSKGLSMEKDRLAIQNEQMKNQEKVKDSIASNYAASASSAMLSAMGSYNLSDSEGISQSLSKISNDSILARQNLVNMGASQETINMFDSQVAEMKKLAQNSPNTTKIINEYENQKIASQGISAAAKNPSLTTYMALSKIFGDNVASIFLSTDKGGVASIYQNLQTAMTAGSDPSALKLANSVSSSLTVDDTSKMSYEQKSNYLAGVVLPQLTAFTDKSAPTTEGAKDSISMIKTLSNPALLGLVNEKLDTEAVTFSEQFGVPLSQSLAVAMRNIALARKNTYPDIKYSFDKDKGFSSNVKYGDTEYLNIAYKNYVALQKAMGREPAYDKLKQIVIEDKGN